LGLVDEEDGMFLLVEEAEGLVRVVWAKAQPETKVSAAAAKKIVRNFIVGPKKSRAIVAVDPRSTRHLISPTQPMLGL
jgi:hypothetical protein